MSQLFANRVRRRMSHLLLDCGFHVAGTTLGEGNDIKVSIHLRLGRITFRITITELSLLGCIILEVNWLH
jgi:hypothetical protein